MAKIRQGDVMKACKGARQAGINVDRIEIGQDGKIVIIAKQGDGPAPPDDDDKELKEFRRSNGYS